MREPRADPRAGSQRHPAEWAPCRGCLDPWFIGIFGCENAGMENEIGKQGGTRIFFVQSLVVSTVTLDSNKMAGTARSWDILGCRSGLLSQNINSEAVRRPPGNVGIMATGSVQQSQ